MSFKTVFSIKDLENLSGIKAHTIRIWEKRYNMLTPERSDTNIRSYSHDSLKKLLNVALLNEKGIKISKISEMKEAEIFQKVRELTLTDTSHRHSINSFKLSMLNFDERLFHDTYNQLLATHSFRDIFLDIFLTFIHEIGVLWMSEVISPANEHFISNLIKQKILVNIERAQNIPVSSEKTFVLYLPVNELHELGLLYVHLELLLKGYRSVFLGASVPLDSLLDIQKIYSSITYISYFTIEPTKADVMNYLADVQEFVLSNDDNSLHLLGNNAPDNESLQKAHSSIYSYSNIVDLIEKM